MIREIITIIVIFVGGYGLMNLICSFADYVRYKKGEWEDGE